MIRKVLIANRGEIACRVVRTCRRLGIGTVAVYSDADAQALHVAMADEAVRIGPAEAASSYLNVDAVIAAALRTGADAIHPGYGFLSESPVLPRLSAGNGIAWIGPSAEAIERMGSKIESKRIAEAAGVACVPGYHGEAQDDAALTAAAREIGFPVLIKASAGGGGRGMRRVDRPEDLPEALRAARSEAQAGFGNSSLRLEKFIERPRHVEVQLAGDRHGNLVHLFERECSIQRNYQKVVEEAPAPKLSDSVRKSLFEAAIRLGRAIGYDSLGTVEFLLGNDADVTPIVARDDAGSEVIWSRNGPWFLEMNTRLQVEHPVTEMITGLDLVEWQIRIAAGEPLPLTQDSILGRGSAIEVRLNAEDPAANYAPQLGTVTRVDVPEHEGVRVDTGIRAGSAVTPYYDSMLAKVIAHGPDRASAAARLSAALSELAVLGVGSNQAFLRNIVDHPQFRAGNLTTRFLAEAFPGGWTGSGREAAEAELGTLAALGAWAETLERRRAASRLGPWGTLGGFRITEPAGRSARVTLQVDGPVDGTEWVLAGGAGRYTLARGDTVRAVEVRREGERLAVSVDGLVRTYAESVDGETVQLARQGRLETYRVAPAIDRAGADAGGSGKEAGNRVVATLPGLVSAVSVEVGQRVEKGETVVVLEAMKLMHSLAAPVSGTVAEVFCIAGETVPAGAALVEIAPGEPS